MKKAAKVEAIHYHDELMAEINANRVTHGKKPFEDDDDDIPPEMKEVTVSTTDLDCGMFRKGEHKVEFAYTTHVACDKHNFILGCDVSAGNVYDSVMFDGLYKSVLAKSPEVEAVALGSGYKTPWIMKQIFDSSRIAATGSEQPSV